MHGSISVYFQPGSTSVMALIKASAEQCRGQLLKACLWKPKWQSASSLVRNGSAKIESLVFPYLWSLRITGFFFILEKVVRSNDFWISFSGFDQFFAFPFSKIRAIVPLQQWNTRNVLLYANTRLDQFCSRTIYYWGNNEKFCPYQLH